MDGDWSLGFNVAVMMLGGLGLLFVGIRLIGDNLRQLADQRLRRLLNRVTDSNRSAALLGIIAGAVTQSVHAVVLILISLVKGGVMDVRRAQPVINFANIGTSLLVLLAAIDIKLMALVLIGISGLLFYGDQRLTVRSRYLSRAALGIGLLFLGLTFFKEGGADLTRLDLFDGLVTQSGQSLLIAFAVGVAFAVVAHSASTVAIVAMALTYSGAVDMEFGLMLIYGAGLGTGLGTILLAGSQPGLGRRLGLYQLILKTMGVLVLVPLFWIEHYLDVPLVRAGLAQITSNVGLQLALVYIGYQLVCDLAIHPLHHRVDHWLERWAPATQAEELVKPKYIYPGAENDVASALVLLDREQQRLLCRLPNYLDAVREESTHLSISRTELHQASLQVAEACRRFTDALLAAQLSGQTLDHAILFKNRAQLMEGLQETLDELVAELERGHLHQHAETRALTHGLVETLHMLLETLADTAAAPDAASLDLLQSLTADRSDLMDQIRHRSAMGSGLTPAMREALFAATSLFERAVWLMRGYGRMLREGLVERDTKESTPQ